MTLSPVISNILTPKCDSNFIKLLAKKNDSLILQLLIQKVTTTLDKIAMNVVLKNCEIARLQEELTKAKSPKHQKI